MKEKRMEKAFALVKAIKECLISNSIVISDENRLASVLVDFIPGLPDCDFRKEYRSTDKLGNKCTHPEFLEVYSEGVRITNTMVCMSCSRIKVKMEDITGESKDNYKEIFTELMQIADHDVDSDGHPLAPDSSKLEVSESYKPKEPLPSYDNNQSWKTSGGIKVQSNDQDPLKTTMAEILQSTEVIKDQGDTK